MTPTLFLAILCISPNTYGQQCISRDFYTLDACKAFVASVEATADGTKRFNTAKGICVPLSGSRK